MKETRSRLNMFRMKHVIAFALVLSAVDAGWAARAPSAGSAAETAVGPRIEFAENVHNFGKVGSADVLRHDFVVTNKGDAVLEINDVVPACGCTMAGAWDRVIPPGATGRIPIQLNPANFHGAIAKAITVVCNDPIQATHALEIRALIWRGIDVQPVQVYFAPVENEQADDLRIVRIINNLDPPLILEPPQCSSPEFNVELKSVQPGREYALHVRYGGMAQPGRPPSHITIKTSSAESPVINIVANAILRPAVAAMPLQITLPTGRLALGHHHSQIIRNNARAPLKVSDAAVNIDGVSVNIEEPEPGRFFKLAGR